MLNIVIPIQEETWKLDDCIQSIKTNTLMDYKITIHKNPSINVGEARQQAMDENKERYICFLDDDTRVLQSGWASELINALNRHNATVAFASEIWEGEGLMLHYKQEGITDKGPAACMLVDTTKIPETVKWNKHIGLSSGWLGGDCEEYEYVKQLEKHGLLSVGLPQVQYLHSDRIPSLEYKNTDRGLTGLIMCHLINYNYLLCPNNPDFFKSLNYVKADPNNDRMLAPGKTLKDCFRGVLKDNNIEHFPMFKRWNLV